MDSVDTRDYAILTRDQQNIVARVYRPKAAAAATFRTRPVYLYFHGGGHLFGTLDTEDAACGRLALDAGVIVVNVNYRHTPEFKHPTQVDDAWDAFLWLEKNMSEIGGDRDAVFVGGVSAGAGLAAWIVLQAHRRLRFSSRDGRSITSSLRIRAQLLAIPWLIHPENPDHPFITAPSSSYQQNVDAPVLPRSLLSLFTDLLSAKDPRDPTLNVALTPDHDLEGLPRTAILVAGQDLLRDEGLMYAERLRQNG